jgi:hypothetical protein
MFQFTWVSGKRGKTILIAFFLHKTVLIIKGTLIVFHKVFFRRVTLMVWLRNF